MREGVNVEGELIRSENFSCKKFGGENGKCVSLQPAKRGKEIDSDLPEGVD
jgi:hypothetical protein